MDIDHDITPEDVEPQTSAPPFASTSSAAEGSDAGRSTVHLSPEDPFDWEAYIANYQGSTRIPRLLHIAKTAPQLRIPASEEAIRLIKETTYDRSTYSTALLLRNTQANGKDCDEEDKLPEDHEWVNEAVRRTRVEGEKLDLELRNYQNNLIKESIRMANRDLADHYRRAGALGESLKCYQRTRDFCSTSEHVVEMCLSVIEVSLELHNYGNVSTFVSKAQGVLHSYNPSAAVASSNRSGGTSGSSVVPPSKGASTSGGDAIGALFRAGGSTIESSNRVGIPPAAGGDAGKPRLVKEVAQIKAKLKVAQGLAALGSSKYELAAMCFSDVDLQQADSFKHIMSAGDVALYIVLCGLAGCSRQSMKLCILDSASLRGFMEHEPHTKEILDTFWNCDYKRGLHLLEKWKSRHLLDIYLHPHISHMTRLIIRRSLSQFCSPFSSVSLSRLGSAFGWDQSRTETEVLGLVERGEIDAKLDWIEKVIITNSVDARQDLFDKTLLAAKKRIQVAERIAFRMQLGQQGLVYKNHREGSGGGGGGE